MGAGKALRIPRVVAQREAIKIALEELVQHKAVLKLRPSQNGDLTSDVAHSSTEPSAGKI